MFEYIATQAKQVAIGPLEYCGNAKVMKTSQERNGMFNIFSRNSGLFRFNGDDKLTANHDRRRLG